MASIQKNAIVYLTANIAVAAVPFILLPILTRYLSPEGYGVISMFTSVLPLMGAVIGFSVHGAVSRRWFDREDVEIPKYVAGCILILLTSTTLVVTVLIVFGSWIATQVSVPLFWLFMAVAVSVSIFIVQIRLVLWQVQEKALTYGAMQFGNSLLNGALSLLLVVFLLKGYEGRLWGHTISYVIYGVICASILYKDGLFRFQVEWAYMKDALSFGVPLMPHVIGGFLLFTADRMIVNRQLGTNYVGIYMVAVQIALGLNLLNESFNKAFVPWLFAKLKYGDERDKHKVIRLTYLYFLVLMSISFVSVYLSKYLITIFAGLKYMSGASVLPWLLLAQSFHGMYLMVSAYIFYERKTHITSTITIICGSCGMVFSWFFIRQFGLVGAGMGSALTMFLQFTCTWYMAAQVHKMPWIPRKAAV